LAAAAARRRIDRPAAYTEIGVVYFTDNDDFSTCHVYLLK
jgi:hypothetical protein